ncbi:MULTISPECIES: COG3904 family protein [Mameliella]|uniref:COG3904 family protein n=1 Tax=Mameliella TaxID=1434019 RepID=UPI000B538113|nr:MULTISPECIES: hypothetical protein [Mameliella]MCR9273708.1 hypothetical protein [Paracoccaceae bacterium]OWV56764.1 hypothetical protein CDZ98_17240 [Mameliella alba]
MKVIFLAVVLGTCALTAAADPMRFEKRWLGGNCISCAWTSAEGEITEETPEAFRTYLRENGIGYSLNLDSPGGNLGAAIALGRLFREKGIRTTVGRSAPMPDMPQYDQRIDGGTCESACVFALIGGTSRQADSGELGVHQFHSPDGSNIPTAATQQIMGQLVLYLIEMGVSAELLTLASKIPGDQMHYLSEPELARLGISTESSRSPLRLETGDGGLVARWDSLGSDGHLDRAYSLRCSRGHSGWLLSVLDTGIRANNGVPDRQRGAPDMQVALGGTAYPMPFDTVIELGPRGDDYFLTVRLPADLHRHVGKDLRFQTNRMTNFKYVLSAQGTVPDKTTLDVLTRACGD